MDGFKLQRDKHLTLEARQEIERCLNMGGVTFKTIARRVGKSPTTVSREVKKHLVYRDASAVHTKRDGTRIADKQCPELMKAPFVCNACEKRNYNRCPYRKQFYYAKKAHEEYAFTLVDSREGIPLNKQEFYDADGIISEAVKEKGQRIYHIMQTYDVGVSMSSAYRYLHRGYLSIGKMDMPRVPKFKARKQYRTPGVPKAAKVGRTFGDFRAHVAEHEISHWVEMDTVIGRVGGKVIMTFNFTQMNFMFGLLMDDKSSAEAAAKIRGLKKGLQLEGHRFGDILPLLLTDNGGEFSNVAAFTDDAEGLPQSRLFFCDPYCSSQKPKVEKNHTIFRDIVPKGESFDWFTQETVNAVFSHVNGGKRKSLNGKSPYEAFAYFFNEEVASLLGIFHVPPENVIQDKRLLKTLKKATPSSGRPDDPGTPS